MKKQYWLLIIAFLISITTQSQKIEDVDTKIIYPPEDCNFIISPDNVYLGKTSGSFFLKVNAAEVNCLWSYTDNASWLSPSSSQGAGTEIITVSYTANTGTTERNAIITIAGIQVSVVQIGEDPPPPPCPDYEPVESITISSPINDNDCRIYDGVIKARDFVKLNRSFSYSASDNNPLTIKTDAKIICSANYLSESNIENPETRDLDESLTFGKIKGKTSVTPTGGATYQILIPIAPGISEMTPSMSVVYNSQSGDGILGQSWHLSGLSSIIRIGQNHYQDGQVKSIEFNDNDRFSLDGNRLVLISGEYGKNGSEYRTELESFAKIKLYGSGTNQYFTVEYKNGTIVEYGKSFNSRFTLTGKSRSLSWHINKITNKNNNYIEYWYKNINNEIVIDKIRYTGNNTAGLSPCNDIHFYYDTRKDNKTLYIGGGTVSKNLILRELKVFSNSSLLRRFKFKYGDKHFSELHEITEYSASGDKVNSTVIGWDNITTSYNITETAHNPCGGTNLFGDFNGDGRIDLLMAKWRYDGEYTSSDKWRVYLGQEGNYFSLAYEGNLNSKFKNFMIGDFDKDGDDDIYMRLWEKYTYQVEIPCLGSKIETKIIPPDDNETCYATYSYWRTRLKFYSFESNTIVANPNKDYVGNRDENDIIISLDFDGDGNLELLFLDPDLTYDHIYGLGVSGDYWSKPDYMKYINFNGNSKVDIMVVKNGDTDIYEYNNGVLDIIYSSNSLFDDWHKKRIFEGDFNGDGKTDILSYNSDKKWYIYFSTGESFTKKAFSELTGNLDNDNELYYGYRVADMNGDGISDILEVKKNWNGGSASSCTFNLYKNYSMEFVKESHVISTVDDIKFGHFFDINGDGIKELILKQLWSDPFQIISFDINEPKYVNAISDGLGILTKFHYEPLSYRGVYYKGDIEQNPEFTNYTQNLYVVSQLDQLHNQNLLARQKYFYSGSVIDREGKGFLGFSEFKVDNHINDISVINKYEYIHGNSTNKFYFPALKERIKKLSTNSEIIEHQTFTNTYDDLTQIIYSPSYEKRKRVFPYVNKIVSNNIISGILTTKNMEYDDFGNIEKLIVSLGNDAVITTTNSYIKAGSWCASKLENSTVKSEYTGEDPFTQTASYTYYSNGNLHTSEMSGITNTYTYDNFGNVLSREDKAPGTPTSSVSFTYDPTKRFVNTKTNTLGQTSTYQYNSLGQLVSKTGIDGLTTSYAYDNWGKLKTVTHPNGKIITTTTHWANESNYAFYTREKHDDFPEVKTYYDVLGREKRMESTGFKGLMYADIIYNSKGEVYKAISPYPASEGYNPSHEITYRYDNYGRIISVTNNGLSTATSYNGRTITETFPSGKTKVTTVDALGNTVNVENNGLGIDYSYYSNGQLKEVTAPGSSLSMTYDANGFKESLTDPDAGPCNFDYNPYGQLESKTTPIGSYTADYDAAGRVITETGYGDISYTYVESGNGINQVESIMDGEDEFMHFDYDEYNRIREMTEQVGDQSMSVNYAYDAYGRETAINYPGGFGIKYVYDEVSGELKEIYTNNNELIWQLQDVNSHNQISKYMLGNNMVTQLGYDVNQVLSSINTDNRTVQDITLTFDATRGRYENRTGFLSGVTENFSYDDDNMDFNQLKGITSAKTELNLEVEYSSIVPGQIHSKSDIGTYQYTQAGNAGPHAISGITDVNENYTPTNQDITYTSFGKVAVITQGDYRVEFNYGPDHLRKTMELYHEGGLKRKVYYFGNYEMHVEGNNVTELYYIYTPTGLAAIYKRDNGATRGIMYYVHTDHLGSIHAITNEAKTPSVVARYYYNPWGEKRYVDKTNGTRFQASNDLSWLHRGFTGHEHITEIGLINMNGRVYDPDLGMFISPDPQLQAPDNPVNFNRYAYVLNNPLVYTDPDGEFWNLVIGAAIGGLSNWIINGAELSWSGLGDFAIGAVAGAAAAGVGGGVSSMLAGESFVAGFVGSEAAATAIAANTSFTNGAVSGGISGFVGGYTVELGNQLNSGASLNDAASSALIAGNIGGLVGSVFSGINSGKEAVSSGRNYWNGKAGRPMYITSSGNIPVDYYEKIKKMALEQQDQGIYNSSEQIEYERMTERINNEIGLFTSGNPPTERNIYINDNFKGDVQLSYRGYIKKGETVNYIIDGENSFSVSGSNYKWTRLRLININSINISVTGEVYEIVSSPLIRVTPSFNTQILGTWVY